MAETKTKQPTLFDLGAVEEEVSEEWREEWKDMPEFVQDKQTPYAMIIMRFRNQEDLDEFGRLIGQRVTPRTKSLWHPQLPRGLTRYKRYKDSDES